MNINTRIIFLFLTILGFLGALIALTFLINAAHHRTEQTELTRFNSFKIADQLRQSSDDLTRMARTYAVTGDESYKEYFDKILEIRDGKSPRPKNYDGIYWDFLTATKKFPNTSEPPIALAELMKQIGVTDLELAKLEEAKHHSDELTNLERIAFAAMKGVFADDDGSLTIHREPDPAFARQILHGDKYHAAKAEIMRPIEEFRSLIDQRTRNEVSTALAEETRYQQITIVMLIVTTLFAIFAFFHVSRKIYAPIVALSSVVEKIRSGKLNERANFTSSGEIETLIKAFNEMSDQTQEMVEGLQQQVAERKRAEGISERLGRIIEQSINEIYIFDAETLLFIQANRGARENLGYSVDEMNLLTPIDIKPEFTREHFEQFIMPLRDKSTDHINFQTVHKRKDGSTYDVEIFLQFMPMETPPIFVAIILDISERKQAKMEAEIAQKQLKEAIETMSEGFAIFDKNDRLVICNSVYRDMYSSHADAIAIGNTLEQILKAGLAKGAFIDALNDEEAWLGERLKEHRNPVHSVEQRLSNGRWLLISEHRTKGGSTVGVRTDITSLKETEIQLRENEAQLRDFGASAADWYWEMDENLRFSYFSDQFTKVTGVLQDILLGKTRQENGNPGATMEAWQEHLENLAHHRSFRNFIHPRTLPDGGVVWLSINGIPVFDPQGQFKGFRGTGEDITQLHETQKQLIESKEAAEQANKAKSEFLASMSHELRTPLNAILGFSQLMQVDPKNALSPAQNVHVESIIEGGNHLLELVNDILDLSQIEADQINIFPKEVNANSVIAESVALTGPLGTSRGIHIADQIDNELPHLVQTDRLRLKQILINLLSNAVKFNMDGGTVSVDCRETDDGFLRISVIDTGIGIAREEYAGIFNLFHRGGVDPMVTREGTGIGLAVTRLLVERMAGRIGFESELGVGSTFWIELPLVSNKEALIWGDASRVGVDAIDRDHQIIFQLINKLTQRPLSDQGLDNAIEKLMNYTRYHFRREEAVMKACSYPGLKEHCVLHQKLTAQVDGFSEIWRKERNQEIFHHLQKFLRQWWTDHIGQADAKIYQYAKGHEQDILNALEVIESTNRMPYRLRGNDGAGE